MLRLSTRRGDRRAASAVELAVVLPLVVFIAVVGADWARLLYFSMKLEGVARSGALFASDQITAEKSPYYDDSKSDRGLKDAALADARDLTGTTTVTADPAYPLARGTTTVVVTAKMNFKTLSNFPGVPAAQTISGRVQMPVLPTATR